MVSVRGRVCLAPPRFAKEKLKVIIPYERVYDHATPFVKFVEKINNSSQMPYHFQAVQCRIPSRDRNNRDKQRKWRALARCATGRSKAAS